MDKVNFNKSMLNHNTLKITLPTSFNDIYLDFEDGASCHLLNGGTTRMGKTTLLLYLATSLYVQTKGEIELHITSTKAKDYYVFNEIENVSITRNETELNHLLDELLVKYKERDNLLYSKELEKATDSKSVKSLYPHKYYLFKPIFLIIDEYARFSDNKIIQKKITELVETAGYVNIHIIISTQRPDGKTVLSPRIKGNLLARICFTTTDKNNSKIILDVEGAEKLGRIQGKALYLDGELNTIQVPYITSQQCEELLKPHKMEKMENEQETKGSIDSSLTNKIQDMFKESIIIDGISQQQQSNECLQQSNETTNNGWFMLESTKRKR